MKLVILPGLDGTGLGLQPFMSALQPEFTAQIILYPPHEPLGYDELEQMARTCLPREPFIVLGESFSGPLALRLAANPPASLKGVVLAASFARLDMPLKRLLHSAAAVASPRLAPARMLQFLLMGKQATPQRRNELMAALAAVAPNVLRRRVRAALSVDLTEPPIRIGLPALYLRATRDRLLPASAPATIASIAPTLTIRDIDAPHFLLQTAPRECAAAIKAFDWSAAPA